MKVGDVVRALEEGPRRYGIVIEIIDDILIPPVCKVLYSSGDLEKEWTDEVEVISEIKESLKRLTNR